MGRAEYGLKVSNSDKIVSRRRLERSSFCSSCTSEAPQEMNLGLLQKVRILLALLDDAKGDGEVVSLMSAVMGFSELLLAQPSQNGTREAMVRFLRISPLPL